jgi:hypothetical protein
LLIQSVDFAHVRCTMHRATSWVLTMHFVIWYRYAALVRYTAADFPAYLESGFLPTSTIDLITLAAYGARFSTGNCTRGVPLGFTLLLRLKRCHACDQCHASRVSTFLPVCIVNCLQTLKAATRGLTLPLTMTSVITTLKAAAVRHV